MANLLGLIIVSLIIFYVGECIGLYMQCDNLDDLQCVKEYIWLVPLIQVGMMFKMFQTGIKENDFSGLFKLIVIGQSSAIILSILAKTIEELKVADSPRKVVPHSSARKVYHSALAALLSIVIVNTL